MYDERRSRELLAIVIVASLAVHAAAWGGLGMLPPLEEMISEFTITSVEIVEEPPEPLPEPEPEPELPPEPEPPPPPPEPVVHRERPTPRTEEPPPDVPPPEPPPAAEEQIEEFTGETLTNDQGESWASAVGTGAPMDGPIGAPTGTVTGRHVEGREGGTVGGTGTGEPGTRLVAVRDLSVLPQPPPNTRIQELIQRFYPPDLRRLAVEGDARVRLRIGTDGRITRVRSTRETEPGFGDACVRALTEAGAWPAGGRDREGNPAATEVNFDCEFRVRR